MPWLFCLCLMLWGCEGAEKLLELLHLKCACLQMRTQLITVCFSSSYPQDSPQDCQSTQQHREQRTTERQAADQKCAVIFKPSLTYRQFMFMEYGTAEILKPKHLSSYAYPGQTWGEWYPLSSFQSHFSGNQRKHFLEKQFISNL